MTEPSAPRQLDLLRYPFEVVTQGGYMVSKHQTHKSAMDRQRELNKLNPGKYLARLRRAVEE